MKKEHHISRFTEC